MSWYVTESLFSLPFLEQFFCPANHRVRPSGLTPPSSPKCAPVIQAFKDMQRSVHDGYLTYMKKGAPGLGQGEPARGNRCRVDSEDHPISLRLKLYVLSLVHRMGPSMFIHHAAALFFSFAHKEKFTSRPGMSQASSFRVICTASSPADPYSSLGSKLLLGPISVANLMISPLPRLSPRSSMLPLTCLSPAPFSLLSLPAPSHLPLFSWPFTKINRRLDESQFSLSVKLSRTSLHPPDPPMLIYKSLIYQHNRSSISTVVKGHLDT